MMERRLLKSGVDGLDELLGGGILEGSIITVSGPTGSGKSTLAAQFICNGALQSDEAGVYIAIEESRRDFMFHMSGFGFDFETLEKDRKFIFLDYPVHEVDQIINQSNAIYEIIRNTGARRVVIDSIMPIALFFHSDDERKKGFLKFIENLRKWNVTVIIVSEDLKMSDQQGSPSSQYGIESFTDGWINLFYRYNESTKERERYLEVIKMKGSAHSSRSVPVALGPGGFSVLTEPRPEPKKLLARAPEEAKPPQEARPPAAVKPVEDEEIEKLVESVFAPAKPKAKPPEPEPEAVPEASERVREPKVKRLSGPAMLSPEPPPSAKAPQARAAPMKPLQKGPQGRPPAAAKAPPPVPKATVQKSPQATSQPKSRPPPAAPKAQQKAAPSPSVLKAKEALQARLPPPKAPPPKPSQSKPPPPAAASAQKAIPPRAAPSASPKAKAAAPSPKKEAMARLLSPPEARPAQQARPAPAKMSDSIAQRIAEAKRKIMKKE